MADIIEIIVQETALGVEVTVGSGLDGADGAPGADGKSAYQVWLDLGNAGTEQEFIDSLKGEDGIIGSDGSDGADGLSAYEVWLAAGNSGTEQEFIDSLTGPVGPEPDLEGIGLELSAIGQELNPSVIETALGYVPADNAVTSSHISDTASHVLAGEKETWNGKQDNLVSGTNIKTLNSESLLGAGDIAIAAGVDFSALTEEMPAPDSDMLFNIGGNMRKKALANVNGFYNLKWFGAVGDGVTDDTNAIKAAMEEIPKGGQLFAPQGTYIITDTIKRAGSLTLIGVGSRGDGAAPTRFQLPAGVNLNMFEFGDRVNNIAESFWLQGFTARGTETSGVSYDLIQLHNYIRHSNVIDVFARGCSNNAFYVQNDAGFTGAQNTYFYGCAAENSLYGYRLSPAYNFRINDCYAGFAMAVGLFVSSTNQIYINQFWMLTGITSIPMIIDGGSIYQVHVTNSNFQDAGAGSGRAHLQINRPDGTGVGTGVIANNNFGRASTTNQPEYCIRVNNPGSRLLITGNNFYGYTNRPITNLSSSGTVKIENNYNAKVGRGDKNYGSGTIPDGSSSVVVNHETWVRLAAHLAVNVTPTSGEQIWVDTVTTDQFTVNRVGTAGALNFFWNTQGRWGD